MSTTTENNSMRFRSQSQKDAIGFQRDRILDKRIEHIERQIGSKADRCYEEFSYKCDG